MKYQITVMIDENGKALPRKTVIIDSETALTTKEVKAKCLAEAAVDSTKSTVTLEELWTSNSWNAKASEDDQILGAKNTSLDYYLSLAPVEAPAIPEVPAKPAKGKKAKAEPAPAEPAPVETPVVETVVETPAVEEPAADAAPEETK
jgi:hypothetical protein